MEIINFSGELTMRLLVLLRRSRRFSIMQDEYSPWRFFLVKINSNIEFNRGFIESFSANALNVFRPYCAEKKKWKHKNYHLFWICVWGELWQGNNRIIVITTCLKSFVFNSFFVHTKTLAIAFKFLQFEERFWKVPFLWRISADSKPNRRTLRFQISPL